jgi:hypothetical protein
MNLTNEISLQTHMTNRLLSKNYYDEDPNSNGLTYAKPGNLVVNGDEFVLIPVAGIPGEKRSLSMKPNPTFYAYRAKGESSDEVVEGISSTMMSMLFHGTGIAEIIHALEGANKMVEDKGFGFYVKSFPENNREHILTEREAIDPKLNFLASKPIGKIEAPKMEFWEIRRNQRRKELDDAETAKKSKVSTSTRFKM